MRRTLLVLLLFAAAISAAPRVRLGGVGVGVGTTWGYPRAWGYPGAWGLYDPYWYSPFVHPGFYGGFNYGPNLGELKLDRPSKDASIYIDGAYAGTAKKLKSMWLEPGAYNLEVRETDGRKFEKKVYVLSGKTLRIRPEAN